MLRCAQRPRSGQHVKGVGGIEAGREPLGKLLGFGSRSETHPAIVYANPPALLFGIVLDANLHWSLQSMHELDDC